MFVYTGPPKLMSNSSAAFANLGISYCGHKLRNIDQGKSCLVDGGVRPHQNLTNLANSLSLPFCVNSDV